MLKETTKYNIPVSGMTCASCVARVEKVLGKFEGLENVKVNYATEKVYFEVTDKTVNLQEAADKLEKYGYKLNLEQEKEEKKNRSKDDSDGLSVEYIKLKKDFRLSLIFTIPVFIISMLSTMYDG
jgi:Cu+-exporting ATPase